MGPLSFWAQRRWKVDVTKRDLNGMEGHGKGQKRGLSWDIAMKGQNRKEYREQNKSIIEDGGQDEKEPGHWARMG